MKYCLVTVVLLITICSVTSRRVATPKNTKPMFEKELPFGARIRAIPTNPTIRPPHIRDASVSIVGAMSDDGTGKMQTDTKYDTGKRYNVNSMTGDITKKSPNDLNHDITGKGHMNDDITRKRQKDLTSQALPFYPQTILQGKKETAQVGKFVWKNKWQSNGHQNLDFQQNKKPLTENNKHIPKNLTNSPGMLFKNNTFQEQSGFRTLHAKSTIAPNGNGIFFRNNGHNSFLKESVVTSRPLKYPANITPRSDLKNLPCPCYWSEKECGCHCNGSLTYDDFQSLAASFRRCVSFHFRIVGGDHYSLPPSLFSRVGSVVDFRLTIANATFEHLLDPTPRTSPFKGVQTEKGHIRVSGVRVKRGWNWTPLQMLGSSRGVELEVDGCGLRRLSSDFSLVADGDVTAVNISGSRLALVGSGAFATFTQLQQLKLPHNRIQLLKRIDMPPMPMQLREIDLRGNQLSSLEDDLFSEMPSLQVVFLQGNPLRGISEPTFGSLIGVAHLQGMSDFALQCDCHLRWLKNSTLATNSVAEENLRGATCRRPGHLRGMPLKDLGLNHLLC